MRAQERELGFSSTIRGLHSHRLDLRRHGRGLRQGRAAATGDRIDASATPKQTKAQVLDIARNTAKLVEIGQDIADEDAVLIEDYAYPHYGASSEETKQAIRLAARLEGMITDPVYEGKSMQGMIDLTEKGFFPAARRCCSPISAVRRRSTATPTPSATGEPATGWTRSRPLRVRATAPSPRRSQEPAPDSR